MIFELFIAVTGSLLIGYWVEKSEFKEEDYW